MGMFSVRIDVTSVNGQTFEEVEAIVDTGSDWSTIPRVILERAGLPVTRQAVSLMADGRQAESDAGWAKMRLEGQEIYAPVIFGEQGEATLLGATALEGAALGVDTNNRRLIPVTLRRY